MSIRRLTVVAAATLLVPLSFVPTAHAAPPSDTDLGCHFVATADPNPEAPEDTMTGSVDGGPILQNGTVSCTLQVGGSTHADANNGASASATGTSGVTYLAPTLVSYSSPPFVPVYLCTQFSDGWTTYYWDDTTATWTTNASSSCELGITASTDNPVFAPVPREYYPKGTIEITYTPGLGTVVGYTHFDPPIVGWNCTAALLSAARTVSCTPPNRLRGFRNVCSALTMEATNVLGYVTGSSRCAGGGDARATAGIPLVTNAAVDSPLSTFAWTCSASPDATAVGPWKVRCSVGS